MYEKTAIFVTVFPLWEKTDFNLKFAIMRKWIFLCAIAVAFTSCNKRQFTIEGNVADADGQTLYLESLAIRPLFSTRYSSTERVLSNSNKRLRNIPSFTSCG